MAQTTTDSRMREILGLCARETAHELMRERLSASLATFGHRDSAWNALVREAEHQGLAPLLYKHCSDLEVQVPEQAHRMLQGLYLRSRRANTIRNSAVREILVQFQLEAIELLLVKGIALSNFAYGEKGLRPMRDIDLLLPKADLDRARQILIDQGYEVDPDHDIPADYYHLPPLQKTLDGLPVTIELHHNLLPLHGDYPPWPFEKSFKSALRFDLDGYMPHTLGLEENLWYIYLHGFRAPLTYEPFRFIHVADIVNLVERNLYTIDWEQVRTISPKLTIFLSRIHFVTPWPDAVISRLSLPVHDRPGRPGMPYTGWPHTRLKTVGVRKTFRLLKDTFWPPQWWLEVYYGCLGRPQCLKTRLFAHPRAIWRWMKDFWYHNGRS